MQNNLGDKIDRAVASKHLLASSGTNIRALLATAPSDLYSRVVDELLTASPAAARVAKTLARAPLTMEETARLIAESRAGAEGQEGLRAFLSGGRPARPGFASWCPPADED